MDLGQKKTYQSNIYLCLCPITVNSETDSSITEDAQIHTEDRRSTLRNKRPKEASPSERTCSQVVLFLLYGVRCSGEISCRWTRIEGKPLSFTVSRRSATFSRFNLIGLFLILAVSSSLLQNYCCL